VSVGFGTVNALTYLTRWEPDRGDRIEMSNYHEMRKEMENRESEAVHCHQAGRTTKTDTSAMGGKHELVNRQTATRTGTEGGR
jgi:hypothetical protein